MAAELQGCAGSTSPLLTVGHGSRQAQELVADLQDARVRLLVDVRRFPGSRRQPSLASEPLAAALTAAGIEYLWEQDLGGRRQLPPGASALDWWWTVPAFRAYAAHPHA